MNCPTLTEADMNCPTLTDADLRNWLSQLLSVLPPLLLTTWTGPVTKEDLLRMLCLNRPCTNSNWRFIEEVTNWLADWLTNQLTNCLTYIVI
jgi:hypothetical protein